VQHDGGGWRCLVPCPSAAISERYFQGDPRPQIDPRSGPMPALSRLNEPEICSGFACMACMSDQQGTPGFPDYSAPRITWVTLAGARDDFVREYLYVIIGKLIINLNYFGTLMD
jgi:hypothetical protein